MKFDIIKYVKELESEFFKENTELYVNSRIEFLRKREEFVGKKINELKDEEGCEGYTISGNNS